MQGRCLGVPPGCYGWVLVAAASFTVCRYCYLQVESREPSQQPCRAMEPCSSLCGPAVLSNRVETARTDKAWYPLVGTRTDKAGYRYLLIRSLGPVARCEAMASNRVLGSTGKRLTRCDAQGVSRRRLLALNWFGGFRCGVCGMLKPIQRSRHQGCSLISLKL